MPRTGPHQEAEHLDGWFCFECHFGDVPALANTMGSLLKLLPVLACPSQSLFSLMMTVIAHHHSNQLIYAKLH